MKWLTFCTMLLVMVLALPRTAQGCPICSEGIEASASDDENADDFPNAMNQSIYLMVGVPYLAFSCAEILHLSRLREEELRQARTGLAGPDRHRLSFVFWSYSGVCPYSFPGAV